MSPSTAAPNTKKRGLTLKRLTAPFTQLWTAYKQVSTIDGQIGGYMALAFVVVLALGALIGAIFGRWWVGLLFALPIAVLAALFVLTRRGEKAAFRRMDGQPGASGAALMTLGKAWYLSQEPVAAEPGRRPNDLHDTVLVFRALGRPGIVLTAEGPRGRAQKVLAKERKRIERVAPGVPVHTFHVGDGEGSTALSALPKEVRRLRPAIGKEEMAAVNKRLTSLPGLRSGIPAGVDPNRARIDRRAMRGR